MDIETVLFFSALICAFIGAFILADVDRAVTGFGLGLLLGPLGLLVCFVVLGQRKEALREEKATAEEHHRKTCPFCAERIQVNAWVCRYCGRDLTEGSPRR